MAATKSASNVPIVELTILMIEGDRDNQPILLLVMVNESDYHLFIPGIETVSHVPL
jgi:hypothetical protein